MVRPDLFDERRYQPAVALRTEYRQRVRAGSQRMRSLTVTCCGLARNVEPYLPRTLACLETTRRLFADSRVLFFENDSQDHTRELLADYQARTDGVTVISQQRGDPINQSIRCLSRAQRMAYYRNQYRRRLAEFPSDAVLVLDLDLAGWSYEGLAHTFSYWHEWDMVGANGLYYHPAVDYPLYYDAWAYRALGSDYAEENEVVNHYRFFRGEPLLPVNSCFGGLGVYRREALLRCSYAGGDCEHVSLHRQLRENGFGRIYLNPSQIVCY